MNYCAKILMFSWLLLTGLSWQPLLAQAVVETGTASYYADHFHGKGTALGEVYDRGAYTAAHRLHPLGTLLRVTRLDNGKSVVVRVNDRGPFVKNRVIDLSGQAAKALDMITEGKTQVEIRVIGNSDRNPVPEGYAKATPMDRVPAGQAPTAYQRQVYAQSNLSYAVQIAGYELIDNATRRIRALESAGFEGVFMRVANDERGRPIYRVVIGPFSDRTYAESYLNDIRRDFNMNGLVIPL